jgi:hypothetical protein
MNGGGRAKSHGRAQVNEQRIKPGAKLGDAYQEKSLPVVRQRMFRAGVRLAKVLNECFE